MSKLYEEVNPFQFTGKGKMDVADASVRDNINTLLTGALMSCTLTPYIALEKVRKVLAYYHISIPGTSFMEGDRGIKTFEVEQFGLKFGMKNDGSVVNFNSIDKDMTYGAPRDGESFNSNTPPGTKVTDEKFHIYFEYKMNDKGLFDVFSEIVTDDELEDLLDDAEEDINADKSEDDRDERLNEAKLPEALDRKATRQAVIDKVLNELIQYNPDRSSSIELSQPFSPGTNPRYYERRERAKPLPPGANPEQKLPNYISKKPADTGPSKSWDSNPDHTKPGGDGPPAGTDPFKGVEPRKPGTPSSALKPGEMSIHGKTNGPYAGPETSFIGPEPKPMSRKEMESGGYSSKITETSHESVNHVRRLAMKKTIKEELPLSTNRRPNPFAAAARSPEAPGQPGSPERQAAADRIGQKISGKITHSAGTTGIKVMSNSSSGAQAGTQPNEPTGGAHAAIPNTVTPGAPESDSNKKHVSTDTTMWDKTKELLGYDNISSMVQGIQQGDTDAVVKSAGKVALGMTPIAKIAQISNTLNPRVTSPGELDQIRDAGAASIRRLAPAAVKDYLQEPYKISSVNTNQEKIQETSHESVNHVRRLAMKNKRNDR